MRELIDKIKQVKKCREELEDVEAYLNRLYNAANPPEVTVVEALTRLPETHMKIANVALWVDTCGHSYDKLYVQFYETIPLDGCFMYYDQVKHYLNHYDTSYNKAYLGGWRCYTHEPPKGLEDDWDVC